jgi:3-oxoadipyl-CoA thiolase
MAEAFIAAALRTPIGKHKGALALARPDDLAAVVLQALVAKHALDAARIDEVVLGCANQAGEDNRNVARMAALLAGFPESVPAVTVNRLCGSGLEAVVQAARMIKLGEAELVVAGGVESMTRAPWSMPKPEQAFPTGKVEMFDTALGWRYPNPKLAARFPLEAMGETAENVAERYGISRADQDAFALASQQKAVAAAVAGKFTDEIVPVEIGKARLDRDESPRADSSLDKLAALKPVFRAGGSVTAGNASPLNDGAAAVLVCSESALKAHRLTPLARVVSSGVVGVDPRFMGIGPIGASHKAVARAGLTVADIDLWEINEAFAAQALACQRELGVPAERLNVNGGAIALGHPLGASGARLIATLLPELHRRQARYGVVTMCIGVGQGIACVLQRE